MASTEMEICTTNDSDQTQEQNEANAVPVQIPSQNNNEKQESLSAHEEKSTIQYLMKKHQNLVVGEIWYD